MNSTTPFGTIPHNSPKMTTNIYVLRLEGGRYYVGKTDNIKSRCEQHLKGNGSAWTKKYKPLAIDKLLKNVSPFQEDATTKEYMSKHGIDKVRGGSYVQIELDDVQKETLNREIWGAKDSCTQCGRKGHWVKDCYATRDVSGSKIEYEEEEEEEDEDYEEDDEESVWECDSCNRTFTTRFGCIVHERSCSSKKSSVKTSVKSNGSCYRCGRAGHYSTDCYASRHMKGHELY